MKESEFWALMEREFGEGYAVIVARSHTLTSLSGRTAAEALAEGEPMRRVWEAVVTDMEIPEEHRWLPEPKRRG